MKAEIKQIGIVQWVDGKPVISGWVFDGHGKGVALDYGPILLIGGYTVRELWLISRLAGKS